MNKHQVIIIGCGLSGLGAATELLENGINDILILEAQNRAGGRVLSVPIDENKSIELGAQWLYSKNNDLFNISKALNILSFESRDPRRICYAIQDGTFVNGDYVNFILKKVDNLFCDIDENTKLNSEDKSLSSIINYKYLEYFDKKLSDGFYTENEIPVIDAIFETALVEEKIDHGCDSLNDLSLNGWISYDRDNEDDERDEMINLKTSFDNLINYFLKKIPTDRVIFNEEVTKIDFSNDKIISIYTYNNKTSDVIVYTADYCICTMSLGYLKFNHQKLFTPKLPLNKINSIERLGFGTVNKLFLIFEDKLFQNDDSIRALQILWVKKVYFNLESFKKWKIDRDKFFQSFECFELLPNHDNILYTFICGEDAIYIENIVDECLIDIIGEMLNICFQDLKLPKIKSIIRSEWNSNKYTKGSYSYIKFGSSIKDIIELEKPVNNRLFFAGEATSKKNGSADGAFESGIHAAEHIIKLFEY